MDLYSNQIGDDGARALVEGLRENETVTMMYLAYNRIGHDGARALADGLREDNATVTLMRIESVPVLRLVGNLITDEALRGVFRLVKQNRDDPVAAAERVDQPQAVPAG